jgi:hypothetical protein
MSEQPSGQDMIRIGHTERDEAASILQAAAADGRLTLEELDERLDAALRARTMGELRPLLADLSPELSQRAANILPERVQGPPPPGYSREDPLVLDGGMSTEKRTGVWTVPPFIRINQGMGTVKMNCLQAIPAAQLIEIELVGGMGTGIIVVPEGWGVDADRLSKSWGTKTIKVSREPAPGKPLLLIHGTMGMGTFKVRPPSPRELRRLNR